MNLRGRKQGYTIVEVLVVLAVTGALLGSAFYFMNGRSRRLAFENDITAFRTKLDDTINNVATGYYSRNANFSCSSSDTGPSINSSGSNARGTNQDCQYIGRGIHFNTGWDYYYIHNIIGLRKSSTGLAQDLSQVKPKVLSVSASYTSSVETAEKVDFFNTTLVKTKTYNSSGEYLSTSRRGFIGFISSLPSADSLSGATGSVGSQKVELYTINDTADTTKINLTQNKNDFVDWFNNNTDWTKLVTVVRYEVCFDSKGSNQRGIVSIGQDGTDTKTSQIIEAGACSSW